MFKTFVSFNTKIADDRVFPRGIMIIVNLTSVNFAFDFKTMNPKCPKAGLLEIRAGGCCKAPNTNDCGHN